MHTQTCIFTCMQTHTRTHHFCVLSCTRWSHVRDRLAHDGKQWMQRLKRIPLAAHHYRQCCVSGAHIATRNWRVQSMDLPCLAFGMDLPCQTLSFVVPVSNHTHRVAVVQSVVAKQKNKQTRVNSIGLSFKNPRVSNETTQAPRPHEQNTMDIQAVKW
jgi:hypothetical protein